MRVNPRPPDHLYLLMLFTRQLLSEQLPLLPRHERNAIELRMHEIDGYLTLHAPTDVVH